MPNEESRRRRVLLVDDDEHCHFIFGTALEFYGFDVERAMDGADGVRRMESSLRDVVLMDVAMPVLDGVSAVRQLRADRRTRELPVVAVTAKASVHEIDDLYEAGFDEVLLKPVDPVKVVVAARKWSRVRRHAG
jgi:CheY-like chemotaxis protein